MTTTQTTTTPSPWSPLRRTVFRTIWIASIVSNIGTLMQTVGVGWLLTTLTASPLLVALLQTATSLPIFLLGFPAGALADLVDRRKLLLGIESYMLIVSAILGIVTLTGVINANLLLLLSLLMGFGAAMDLPIWAAIVPDLVEKDELHAAISLNATGFNLARAVGPALGGVVVAMAGPSLVFFLNSLSFIAIIIAVYGWKTERPHHDTPPEDILGAIVSGARYAWHSRSTRNVLFRTTVFVFGASAIWALIPTVARHDLKLDATWYGVVIGSLGIGAVAAAPILPKLRQRIHIELFTAIATAIFASTAFALGTIRSLPLLVLFLFLGGMAWLAMMTSVQTAAANSAPAWVRARVLGLHMISFAFAMTLGSYGWGALAQHYGNNIALMSAAGVLLLGLLSFRPLPLHPVQDLDLTPSNHWAELNVALNPAPGDGPVMVTVRYHVPAANAAAFLNAMEEMRRFRFREGAIRWDLYRDMNDIDLYVESFVVSTWGEHIRQHTRVTKQDQAIEQRAFSFLAPGTTPVSSHLIAADASEHHLSGEALKDELPLI